MYIHVYPSCYYDESSDYLWVFGGKDSIYNEYMELTENINANRRNLLQTDTSVWNLLNFTFNYDYAGRFASKMGDYIYIFGGYDISNDISTEMCCECIFSDSCAIFF